mmetsp:Transcript_6288/g.8120  ORF Transcript_6288/g.8120 Transcript_6288/m.8120 type:complete len:383 (+) Transcript_6288:18-1166(+)
MKRNTRSAKKDEPQNLEVDGPTKGQSAEKVRAAESNVRKVLVRTISGGLFVILFNVVIWAGHFYTILFVFLLQCGCFREMARVGLDTRLESRLPGFYNLMWAWFLVAACFMYGNFFESLTRGSTQIDTSSLPPFLSNIIQYQAMISLIMYGAVFVATVMSLRPPQESYLYQLQRLAFIIVSLMIIFGQMQSTLSIIYKGLFWYFVPAAIVMTNDIMAYFTGVALGRKIYDQPLLVLSPNKTYEGFIGAIIWTSIFAFFFSGHVSQFKWMICPSTSLTLQPHLYVDCIPNKVFNEIPFSSLPRWWPQGLSVRPVQFHMVVIAIYASLVGPFGGFIASAIKRAYDIKDFAAFLPGHGGLMDRNDCQMLTCLFVGVYVSTFIRDL